jgi:hypothetical protein
MEAGARTHRPVWIVPGLVAILVSGIGFGSVSGNPAARAAAGDFLFTAWPSGGDCTDALFAPVADYRGEDDDDWWDDA